MANINQNLSFVEMNSIEQNMLMTTNNTLEILNRMGPARNNMAVVEPVPDPIPAEPPDMVFQFYFEKKKLRCFTFYRPRNQFKLITSLIIWILMLAYVYNSQHSTHISTNFCFASRSSFIRRMKQINQ